MQRAFREDRGRNRIAPIPPPPSYPPTVTGDPRPGGFFEPTIASSPDPQPIRQGNIETLTISDWTRVLAPILNGQMQGLTGTRHNQYSCYIDLPVVNIRLRYQAGAFANAIGAADFVTIADVLKRTNPVTYKGVIEAAWKSGIDELVLSSTWRPMLGSILHRMGIGLDVVSVDDCDDRDSQGGQIRPFSVNTKSGARSSLYSTFESFIFSDSTNLAGFKADPWVNTDATHSNHLHVSAVDMDAQ